MPQSAFHQPTTGKHKAQHSGSSSHTNVVSWSIFSIILLLLIAGVAWGLSLYSQAHVILAKEKTVLSSVSSLTHKAQTGLKNSDAQALIALSKDPSLHEAQHLAQEANQTSHSTSWRLLSHLPIVGNDVKTLQVLTQTSAEATQTALPPLLEAVSILPNQQLSDNGELNLQPLTEINTRLQPTRAYLSSLPTKLEALPPAHLGPVVKVQQKINSEIIPALRQLSAGLDTVQYVTNLASSPQEKTIILASATPAEIHSSSGLIGSLGSMTIGNNRINIGQFQPNTYFEKQGKALNSPEAEQILNGYGHYYTMDIRDVTLDPDFDNVAKNIINVWQASPLHTAQQPLGVLLVDPVFVQELIKQTGPVTLPTGLQVTGDNTANYLQNGVYLQSNSATIQDAIFAAVTAQAVDNITNNLKPMTVIQLAQKLPSFAKKRHISFYSTDPKLEALAEAQNLTPRAQYSEEHPQLGFYFNSEMASKMDFYSQRSVVLKQIGGPTQDGEQGQRTYQAVLTIKNTLDEQTLSSLPLYIHGDQPGHLVGILLAYAPHGGTIRSLQGQQFNQGTWNGKKLLHNRYNILPGQQAQYTFEVTTSAKAKNGLGIDMSPQTR